jgi:hypothetical protein
MAPTKQRGVRALADKSQLQGSITRFDVVWDKVKNEISPA